MDGSRGSRARAFLPSQIAPCFGQAPPSFRRVPASSKFQGRLLIRTTSFLEHFKICTNSRTSKQTFGKTGESAARELSKARSLLPSLRASLLTSTSTPTTMASTRVHLSLVSAFLFLISLFFLHRHTDGHPLAVFESFSAHPAREPKLHFLLPATNSPYEYCKTLLTTLVNDYEPIVINWESEARDGVARLEKVSRSEGSEEGGVSLEQH